MLNDTIKEHQQVWENCLGLIKKEITPQSFSTWFQPIRPVKLVEGVLTIEVPSPFFYEWLEEYYVHILKKAIYHELGSQGKLEYSIVVDKGNKQNEPFTFKVRNGGNSVPPPQTVRVEQKPPIARSKQAPKKAEKDARMQQSVGSPFELPQLDPDYTASQLNPNYTFSTYIEGDCNKLARAAGMAIAERPGTTSFNPLVIYGGVGLGKTHLAQAIGSEIKRNYPQKFVLYVTSEQFTAQFIEALKTNTVQNFTNFYLQVDALIIDDIQFLARKEKTQETFFHIFNNLHQSGRQIIMTSDQPPKSIQGLQERLLSRFKWGLTADVQTPGFETRLAIVQNKIEAEGVPIPRDVIEYLAYNINTNIRELEGVLISLIAKASFMRQDIDMELAKKTLMNIIRHTEKKVTVDFIQQIVSEYFKISVEDLKSKTRKKAIATARQIAMHFSKEYTNEPLKRIGDSFGGRDHSTVVHASKAVVRKSSSDALYGKILQELQDQIKA